MMDSELLPPLVDWYLSRLLHKQSPMRQFQLLDVSDTGYLASAQLNQGNYFLMKKIYLNHSPPLR